MLQYCCNRYVDSEQNVIVGSPCDFRSWSNWTVSKRPLRIVEVLRDAETAAFLVEVS